MRAGAQARTFFAGFGVSGSLLAAVGVAAVLAGGVLAFDQWPREPGEAPPASVNVAAAQRARPGTTAPATQARAIALPAAIPVTSSRRSGRRGTAASGRSSRRPATGVGGRPTSPGAPVTPATPPIDVTPTGPGPTPGPHPVADTVEGAAAAVANVVRGAGTALPAARPVTDGVAQTADDAGRLVGGIVRALTGGRR